MSEWSDYKGGEVWAIDPATNTGFAEGLPGAAPKLSVQKFIGKGKDEGHAELFGRATFFLAERLQHSTPGLIVIEAPLPPLASRNIGATEIGLGLNGIFIGIAMCKRIPVMPAHIAAWRKYFIGAGNLKGEIAKARCLALCEKLGWETYDHNAAEAAGIWAWACANLKLASNVEPLFARGS